MKNGLDTNRQTGASAACLKSSGIDFVMRYYSPGSSDPNKPLNTTEAIALGQANIEIGVIFENSPVNVTVDYFTNAQGQADGASAWSVAQSLAQLSNSCIYFAVDFDAQPNEIASVVDYFRGVQTGMNTAAGGSSAYTVGVYGSGCVCQAVKEDNGLATYSWLTLSRGWCGVKTYATWDVNQANSTSPLCGFAVGDYDEDQAQDNFGGFLYPSGQTIDFRSAQTAAEQTSVSIIQEIVRQLEKGDEPGKQSKFFRNGIELIDISVQVGTVKIDLKVAGPKPPAA
jgi:hypothetical protein